MLSYSLYATDFEFRATNKRLISVSVQTEIKKLQMLEDLEEFLS